MDRTLCTREINGARRAQEVTPTERTPGKALDQEAFAREVFALRGSLYRVAAGYLSGESDRLDAVSEAVARGWERRASLRDTRYFATWLTRILIRECVNIQRRQRRTVPVERLPETPARDDAEAAALREALGALPQKLRVMTVLHYMEGYDVREVAAMLGTTKGAVCAGLSRARERLRALLEDGAY